jgi:dipeptidase
MRKPWLVLVLVPILVAINTAPAQDRLDCFSVVAGKGCTADESVLFAHNEDDGGPVTVFHWRIERTRHGKKDEVNLRRGGKLPQVQETFGYLWSQLPGLHYSDTYLNDCGVAVASNAASSREDRLELTDNGIGFMLRRLVAERARSARHGVDIATGLVTRFGYTARGRVLTIADAHEAWLVCLVGGRHWLAARVPDDQVIAIANTFPIHTVDPGDTSRYRMSPGLVAYARERGWYDPARGPFDFARAFANPAGHASPSNYLRQWRAIQLLAAPPDRPLEAGPDLPDFFRPKKTLTPADLMAVLRDHYEGTPLDLTNGYQEGSPNRTENRTICTDATRNAVVFQLRADLPPAIGALMWIAMRRPDGSPFLPWYLGMRDVPPGFSRGDVAKSFAHHFDDRRIGESPSGYRTFEGLCDRLDEAYGKRHPAVSALRCRLEDMFVALQPEIEETAVRLHEKNPAAARDLLTACSYGQTARAVREAVRLNSKLAGGKE